MAHGYAKASGRMMGAILHSNVGLLHATMAIFNAWCDRVPMLILGATGPWDAAKRRPWIDWIHTRSEEHTSELQSRGHLVCRLLLEKKKKKNKKRKESNEQ